MNNIIRCIHCQKEFELSDVFIHQFEEEAKMKAIKAAKEEANKEISLRLEEAAKEKKELLEQNKTLSEQLTGLSKLIKELQEKNDKRDEEEAARIKKAEEKIKEEAQKEASEKHRLEKLEWEKRNADQTKLIEELERKSKQGSQQLQGEVLELDLEEKLKAQFPLDEFLPIPKGVEGGDIWQKVIDNKGNSAGSIIWETKRTKTWDKKWLRKLREDMGRVNASECILVSQILPPEIKGFHNLNKVWVTNYEYALHIARVVRFIILKTAVAKLSAAHTDEDLQKIRDFITSEAFKHKIDMHHDTVDMMMDELRSEIRLTQTRWKKREAQIRSLDDNISKLDGEIQGIMGASLPDIKHLSLPEGDIE